MDLNYNAIETFSRIHADPNKYIFCRGPVGSGKSSGCIWHILLNALEQKVWYDQTRFSRYAVIRASYPALKSTVIKSWQNWFKGLITIVYDTPIRGEIKLPHPDGESEICVELIFIALDREDDVNKLQSLELTGAHVNEAAEIPRGVHQMLKSRINRYPQEPGDPNIKAVRPFIICDFNSVDTEHWLYKIAEEEKPPKHSFYHQPSALDLVENTDPRIDREYPIVDTGGNYYVINKDADNVENLDEDYYTDQVYGAEPDWVNVMILNNYGMMKSGRPVYSDYDDTTHHSEKEVQPLKGVPIIIGMDLGLTPAAAFTQLTPMGQLNVFDEIVTEDCSIEKFLDEYLRPHIINNYSGFNYEIIVDPAATVRSQNDAKAAAELLRKRGLPYRTAPSNNPLKRREAVSYFLRRVNGFLLAPKCKFLRKGFISEYKYEKKKLAISAAGSDPKYKEKPDKNIYSHIHDGLQYAALELSGGRTAKRRGRRDYTTTDYSQPADSSAGY
jgi:hypothetical protein